MRTHTPGPWTYEPITLGHPSNRANRVVGSPTNYIARLFSADSTLQGMTSRAPAPDEAEANARLIASAPDLLAACMEAFGALVGSHAAEDSVQGRARARLRAVIDKANGELP